METQNLNNFKPEINSEDDVFQPIAMHNVLDTSDFTQHQERKPSRLKRSASNKSIVLIKDVDYLEKRL